MQRWLGLLLVALVWGSGLGCQKSVEVPEPVAAVPASAPGGPALSRLPTIRLWLGMEEVTAEVAQSVQQIMTGMMFRTNILEGEGMLFVFPAPRRASFWMKNVSVPMTCAYIDSEGTIREIHDMEPHEEDPIQASSATIQYVLEMKRGWYDRHRVSTGMLVRTEAGSLRDSFFGSSRAR